MGCPPSFLSVVDGVRSIPQQPVAVVTRQPADFHERQRAAQCGMHALHNLLRNDTITKETIDKIADKCAKESGDRVGNHKHASGLWSIDTLIRALQEYGYDVLRAVKTMRGEDKKTLFLWNAGDTMYQLLEEPTVVGFLIHEKFHYTALRKNQLGTGWEYSNSFDNVARDISPFDFCKKALDGTWNIFLVTVRERVSL